MTHHLTIAAGVMQHTLKLDENGQMPQRLIVGFLKHTARSGHYQQNPYNFQNFGVEHVSMIFNCVPSDRSYQPNFNQSSYSCSFMHLIGSCNRGDVDADIGVS